MKLYQRTRIGSSDQIGTFINSVRKRRGGSRIQHLKNSRETSMTSQYRKHLILPATYRDQTLGDWTASVHIEFTEKLTVHTVVLRPADVFQTESQAEKYIIQRAKEWVDKRLQEN